MLALLWLAQAQASGLVRGYTPRYSVTARGDMLIIGNTLMTCLQTGLANCDAARGGTGGDLNNNSYSMQWVNQDNVTTSPQNSFSAVLTIPAGSTVLYAALYWGADTSAGTAVDGVPGVAAPSPTARNIIQFATPASAYVATTATATDASGTRFSSVANVTSRVQAGGSGTYRVAGLQAGRGSDRYGGWSLVVVVSNPALTPRNMVLFDGFAVINTSGDNFVTTPVSGFRTPSSGAVNRRVGFIAYEDDLGSGGDQFLLNTTNLSDAVNPTTNVFNSTISAGGVNLTAKSPNYINQLGFDADLVTANNVLPNGATSANLTFRTTSETYYPAAILFSTEVFQPVLESNLIKSVTDLNGGTVAPGDVLEYTIAYGNTGNDGALQTVMTDVITANTTYVPNSLQTVAGPNNGAKTDAAGDDQANFTTTPSNRVVFRLGTGAGASNGGRLAPGTSGSVRFRVQVNAGAVEGAKINNTEQIAFVSESLNEPLTADSNTVTVTVSNRADVSITKANKATQVVAGEPTTYVITVSNPGPAPADNAVVRDPATPSINRASAPVSGTATCEGTNGVLCPGGLAAGSIPVASLQAAADVVIPTLPSGGQIRIELTCVAR